MNTSPYHIFIETCKYDNKFINFKHKPAGFELTYRDSGNAINCSFVTM